MKKGLISGNILGRVFVVAVMTPLFPRKVTIPAKTGVGIRYPFPEQRIPDLLVVADVDILGRGRAGHPLEDHQRHAHVGARLLGELHDRAHGLREVGEAVGLDPRRQARTEADLVLVVGSRLGETDWWGKAPYWGRPGEQKTIQVDIDPEHLGNIRQADLPILADAKLLLSQLLDATKRHGAGPVRVGLVGPDVGDSGRTGRWSGVRAGSDRRLGMAVPFDDGSPAVG